MVLDSTGCTLQRTAVPQRPMPASMHPDAGRATATAIDPGAIDPGAVFRHAAAAMVLTDDSLHILAANPAYTALTGLAEREFIGTVLGVARPGLQAGGWESAVRHRSGQLRPVWVSQATVRDRQGTVQWLVVTLNDISALDRERASLRHQAHHDPLTQLPNRMLFQAEFERTVARAHRHAQRLALLFIDLDRFKWVNDTLGHAQGDVVLREVARRLRSTVRTEDLVARWGGDEFIVVLDNPPDAMAAARAARLLLSAIERGIEPAGHRLRISASIGVALYPDHGPACADLLRAGDAAMYRAKQLGGRRVELAGPDQPPG